MNKEAKRPTEAAMRAAKVIERNEGRDSAVTCYGGELNIEAETIAEIIDRETGLPELLAALELLLDVALEVEGFAEDNRFTLKEVSAALAKAKGDTK